MDPSSSFSSPSSRKHIKCTNIKPHNQVGCTTIYLYTLLSFFIVVTLQSLSVRRNAPQMASQSKHLQELIFYPLKNPTVAPYTNPDKTWFMSTLTGRAKNGLPEHFVFPSRAPYNKILCINLQNKTYSLASAANAVPTNATILGGITFVADSFYDYKNPWHGLNAISGFFAWMRETGCAKPRRFLLFRNGELVEEVGSWVSGLMKAVLEEEVTVVGARQQGGGGVVCFEKAVVMRRALGGMSGEKRRKLFEMVRCRAWRHCNATRNGGDLKLSLVGREGKKRGFKNESGVANVLGRQCDMAGNCSFKLLYMNTSFCQQVREMRNTDILVSIHGAQLTNMMFMPKGSSVMEMFPTGWLEGAGVGQFIYQWFANWTEMSYEGAWRDASGMKCLNSSLSMKTCFHQQKDQQVGLNETYLEKWIEEVIQSQWRRKIELSEKNYRSSTTKCACDRT